VDNLLRNAGTMMETFRDAAQAGLTTDDWTVFVTPEGGLQMIAGYEGSLESLTWSRGARTAWRATRRGSCIAVEAQGPSGRCLLEERLPGEQARSLLSDMRLYLTD
jgi:hypothetical protein